MQFTQEYFWVVLYTCVPEWSVRKTPSLLVEIEIHSSMRGVQFQQTQNTFIQRAAVLVCVFVFFFNLFVVAQYLHHSIHVFWFNKSIHREIQKGTFGFMQI